MSTIKIAIADEQSFFRPGLALLLHGITEIELLVQAHNGRELLSQLHLLQELPQLILIDLDMPGTNGMEMNRMLHLQYPSIKVVLVSLPGQERFISKLIEAGACGHLSKNCNTAELVTCIKAVDRAGFYFSDETLNAMRNALQRKKQSVKNEIPVPVNLSVREQEILYLICKGLASAEIADKLFLSVRTIETHRNSLVARTGSRNTAGLVLFAVRYGLYNPTT
jgi:DNA-binding NarL/FixJ family response regulator